MLERNGLSIITEQKSTITMSSVEIAKICDKRHDHVMRDIRNMLTELEIQSPQIWGDYTDNNGRTYPCAFLSKRETLILVSGYRIDLRAKIIDRLNELESQQAVRLPQNFSQALRELADQVEQNQVLQLENHQKTEHIHSLENYFQAGLTPPQFVKGLNGVNCQKINDFLRSKGWLYKDNSRCWRVFAQVRDKYLTEESKRILTKILTQHHFQYLTLSIQNLALRLTVQHYHIIQSVSGMLRLKWIF